jgi:uncharacterized protein (DUF2237 family)
MVEATGAKSAFTDASGAAITGTQGLWCVCAERWKEAYQHGFAPKVFLKRTHKKATTIIDIEILKEYAVDLN